MLDFILFAVFPLSFILTPSFPFPQSPPPLIVTLSLRTASFGFCPPSPLLCSVAISFCIFNAQISLPKFYLMSQYSCTCSPQNFSLCPNYLKCCILTFHICLENTRGFAFVTFVAPSPLSSLFQFTYHLLFPVTAYLCIPFPFLISISFVHSVLLSSSDVLFMSVACVFHTSSPSSPPSLSQALYC